MRGLSFSQIDLRRGAFRPNARVFAKHHVTTLEVSKVYGTSRRLIGSVVEPLFGSEAARRGAPRTAAGGQECPSGMFIGTRVRALPMPTNLQPHPDSLHERIRLR